MTPPATGTSPATFQVRRRLLAECRVKESQAKKLMLILVVGACLFLASYLSYEQHVQGYRVDYRFVPKTLGYSYRWNQMLYRVNLKYDSSRAGYSYVTEYCGASDTVLISVSPTLYYAPTPDVMEKE